MKIESGLHFFNLRKINNCIIIFNNINFKIHDNEILMNKSSKE